MLISSKERNVSKLVFKVNSEGFDPIAHRVSGYYAGDVHKELRNSSLLLRLLISFFVFRAVVLAGFAESSFIALVTNFNFLLQVVIILFGGFLLIVLRLFGGG